MVLGVAVLRPHLIDDLFEQPVGGPLDGVLARRDDAVTLPFGEAEGEVGGVFNRRTLHHADAHSGMVAEPFASIFVGATGGYAHHVEVDLARVVGAHAGVGAAGAVDYGEVQLVAQHLVGAVSLRDGGVLHRRAKRPRQFDPFVHRGG